MLAVPSCGSNHFADDAAAAVVRPTLGHAELAQEGTADDSSATSSTEVATSGGSSPDVVFPPPGPPLEPQSSAELIREAIEDAHGPTDDVAGQMNRFVTFPDLPTPAGTEIIELRADLRDTLDGQWILVTAEVTVQADGTVDDLVTFYESELTPFGWLQTPATEHAEGPGRLRRLGFAIPDSSYELDDVTVELMALPDGAAGAGARSQVRLRYVALLPIDDQAPRERLAGWAADLPLPEGGAVTGAGIQTTSIGRHSLHYSLALRYDGADPETVAAQVRSLLPTEQFAIDPQPVYGDKLDNWVYLTSPSFADSRISTHTQLAADTGPTLVNVDARVEFEPS
jgi:hypothetical protein